jgi:hypothetical protein
MLCFVPSAVKRTTKEASFAALAENRLSSVILTGKTPLMAFSYINVRTNVRRRFHMKSKKILLAMLAFALVLGMTMAACGGSSAGDNSVIYQGKSGDDVYTLKITGSARYAAKSGDDYELTLGSKKNKGTVDGVSGSEFTLKPSNSTTPIKANVSGNDLQKLDGVIVWTLDNGSEETATVKIELTTLTIKGGESYGSLSLSGQVYTQKINLEGIMNGTSYFIYEPYTGSMTLKSNAGGSGSITNGKLSFNIGTPTFDSLEDFELYDKTDSDAEKYNVYKDIKVVPSDTKGATLDFEDVYLSRMVMDIKISKGGDFNGMTMDYVWYTYVDKNCRITATGGNIKEEGATITFPNLDITLNQGWNILNMKVTSNGTTGTIKLERGDLPSCKWVLDDGSDDDYDDWW